MQRTQQLLTLTSLVFLLSISIILHGCQQSEVPEETNEILVDIIKNTNEKILVNIEMASNLEEKFQVPLDLDKFMTPPFFSDYRNDINSIISESDITNWNNKIENYKSGRFEITKLANLPIYDPQTGTVLNSNDPISEFEKFATFSPPFLSTSNDKALIYVKFLNHPDFKSPENSFLLILRKQNGTWNEVYRKLMVVTTS